MSVYNENRDNNNSMRDEIREQNAKLKNASFKEKLSYFKDYYLLSTLAIIGVTILIGCVLHTTLTAPRETAFGALFFNSFGDSSDTSLIDEFIARRSIDTTKAEAFIDSTYRYSSDKSNTYDLETVYLGLQKSMALVTSKDVDIIAGDQDAFDYFCRSDCFADVTTVLPPEMLEKYKDQLYYFTNEETGETLPLGIYVTDSPKLNEHLYYIGKEPILGFVINSERTETALDFLQFIYE